MTRTIVCYTKGIMRIFISDSKMHPLLCNLYNSLQPSFHIRITQYDSNVEERRQILHSGFRKTQNLLGCLQICLFALCYTFDLKDYMSTTTQNVFRKIRKYVQLIITSRFRYNLHRITLCSCDIAERMGNILRDIIGPI